jgi:hypothetical protein
MAMAMDAINNLEDLAWNTWNVPQKPKALRGALFIHGKQRRTLGFHHEKPMKNQ